MTDTTDFDFIPAKENDVKEDTKENTKEKFNFDFIPSSESLFEKAVYDTCKLLVQYLTKPKVSLILRDTSEKILKKVQAIFAEKGHILTFEKNIKQIDSEDPLNLFRKLYISTAGTVITNYASAEKEFHDGFIVRITTC